MGEVDENLNYLLGRLSLVTQEFNQIKVGLGNALDNIRTSFQLVQNKVQGKHQFSLQHNSIFILKLKFRFRFHLSLQSLDPVHTKSKEQTTMTKFRISNCYRNETSQHRPVPNENISILYIIRALFPSAKLFVRLNACDI